MAAIAMMMTINEDDDDDDDNETALKAWMFNNFCS